MLKFGAVLITYIIYHIKQRSNKTQEIFYYVGFPVMIFL